MLAPHMGHLPLPHFLNFPRHRIPPRHHHRRHRRHDQLQGEVRAHYLRWLLVEIDWKGLADSKDLYQGGFFREHYLYQTLVTFVF